MAEGKNIPFGADTTESVSSRKETKVGQANNMKDSGATGMAGSDRTSAGGDTISPSNTNRENWGAGASSHGKTLRNPNIASLSPGISNSSYISTSTVTGGAIAASLSFANIPVAFDTFSGTFSQDLPSLNTDGQVRGITINNTYTSGVTSSTPFSGSSSEANGAGWSQVGSEIVWTNGSYASFNAAAFPTGNSVNGTGLIADFAASSHSINASFSGTGASAQLEFTRSLTVTAVYSGNSTGSTEFVQSFEGTGAGWIQEGNNLLWTNGPFEDFSAGVSAEAIPASGQTYYVNYTFGQNSLIPPSGATYYLDISYEDFVEGGVDQGSIAGLSQASRLNEVRIGKGLFGSKNNGVEEVSQSDRGEVSRDNINMPTNQDSQRDQSIPNVASRFFR